MKTFLGVSLCVIVYAVTVLSQDMFSDDDLLPVNEALLRQRRNSNDDVTGSGDATHFSAPWASISRIPKLQKYDITDTTTYFDIETTDSTTFSDTTSPIMVPQTSATDVVTESTTANDTTINTPTTESNISLSTVPTQLTHTSGQTTTPPSAAVTTDSDSSTTDIGDTTTNPDTETTDIGDTTINPDTETTVIGDTTKTPNTETTDIGDTTKTPDTETTVIGDTTINSDTETTDSTTLSDTTTPILLPQTSATDDVTTDGDSSTTDIGDTTTNPDTETTDIGDTTINPDTETTVIGDTTKTPNTETTDIGDTTKTPDTETTVIGDTTINSDTETTDSTTLSDTTTPILLPQTSATDDVTTDGEAEITTLASVQITGTLSKTEGEYYDGDNGIQMSCSFEVTGPAEDVRITWQRNGVQLGDRSTRLRISTNLNTYGTQLTFNPIKWRDNGNYSCELKEKSASESLTETVKVYEKPVVNLFPSVITLTTGDIKQLQCSIVNVERMFGQYTFSWCFNGQEIENPNVTRVDEGREMLNLTYTDNDAGSYECGIVNCTTAAKMIKTSETDNLCQEEKDDKGITWPETEGGQTVRNSCPTSYSGFALRQCENDGSWASANYLNCVNINLLAAENQIEAIKEGSVGVEAIEAPLEALLEVAGNKNETTAGDLDKIIDILAEVTTAVAGPAVTASIQDSSARSFIGVVNTVLSPDRAETAAWKQVQSNDPVKASKLMQSMANFGLAVANSQKSTDPPLDIVTPSLVVEIGKVTNMSSITFPPAGIPHPRVSFFFPVGNIGRFSDITYVATVFKSLEEFLPENDTRGELQGKEINSPIVSFSVQINHKDVRELDDEVQLFFEKEESQYTEPSCGYWDYIQKGWMTDGCRARPYNESFTVCECDHLTDFAVFMKPLTVEPPSPVDNELDTISLAGSAVTILGCLGAAMVTLIFWRYFRSNRSVIRLNLYIALIAAYVVFMAGVNRAQTEVACAAVEVMLQFFFMSAFFMMLAEGLDVLYSVVKDFNQDSKLKVILPLAWGCPALIVLITQLATRLTEYKNTQFCWVTIDDPLISVFAAPAALIILINFGVFIYVLKNLRLSKYMAAEEDIKEARSSVGCLCVLMPVLAVCWVTGVMSVNYGHTVYYYVFTAFNTLQGLLIFVCHVLFNTNLHGCHTSDNSEITDDSSGTQLNTFSEFELKERNPDSRDTDYSPSVYKGRRSTWQKSMEKSPRIELPRISAKLNSNDAISQLYMSDGASYTVKDNSTDTLDRSIELYRSQSEERPTEFHTRL